MPLGLRADWPSPVVEQAFSALALAEARAYAAPSNGKVSRGPDVCCIYRVREHSSGLP
jgi:hypothetical protein